MANEEVYISAKKASEMLDIHPSTLAIWIRNGELKAKKKNPNKRNSPYLVPLSEVKRHQKLQELGQQN